MTVAYVPEVHDDPHVLAHADTWADPVHVPPAVLRRRRVWKHGRLVAMEDELDFDSNDKPLNPYPEYSNGRIGRGKLGKWGPNHAADPLLTRTGVKDGTFQVLVVYRGDQEGLVAALPGGMVEVADEADLQPSVFTATVQRELCEEAVNADASRADAVAAVRVALDEDGHVLYSGIVNEPRNTENAWIETQVIHAHLASDVAEALSLQDANATDGETKGAVWMDMTETNLAAMYANHGDYVRLALFRLIRMRVEEEEKTAAVKAANTRAYVGNVIGIVCLVCFLVYVFHDGTGAAPPELALLH